MDDICSAGLCAGVPLDEDADGYVSNACNGNDCDDLNANINPGITEASFGDPICQDGLDNDCDTFTDISDTG